MSSRIVVRQPSAAARKLPVTTPVAVVRPIARVDAVAEEVAEEKETSKFTMVGDPLWGMAVASVILFAALAALMAFI